MGQSNSVITAVVSDYAGSYNHSTENSLTLQARDYKGFGRQAATGIIQKETDG